MFHDLLNYKTKITK